VVSHYCIRLSIPGLTIWGIPENFDNYSVSFKGIGEESIVVKKYDSLDCKI